MSVLWAILRRDLTLAVRAGGGLIPSLSFFVLVIILIPFAVGPDPQALARIGPGMLWLAALLSVLISLDRLFQADLEDGSLDQFALSPEPLELIVLAKCLAHWLTTGLPITLIAPVLMPVLGLEAGLTWPIVLSLLIGTPALTLIGAIGAAISAGVRRGGMLLAVLILPLQVPTLIFGAASTLPDSMGASGASPILVLGAFSLLTAALAPFAAAAALRAHLS